MTPSEIADNALNATLEKVQSLMKLCIKLKASDPGTLTLSDEIARWLAKDLKLYGGSATSFSPQLLSCAAIVRQHSKAGAFVSLPDWTSVMDNDLRIKSHPQCHKMVDYRPFSQPEPTTSSSAVPAEVQSTTQTLTKSILAIGPTQLASSKAKQPVPPADQEVLPNAFALRSPTVPVTEPIASDIQSTTACPMIPELPTPHPPSISPVVKSRKRKAEETHYDEMTVMHGHAPAAISRTPIRKLKKVASGGETIDEKHKTLLVKTWDVVAMDTTYKDTYPTDWVDNGGVWDTATRLAGPNINPPPKRPRMHENKSRPASKKLAENAPAKTIKPSTRSSSRAQHNITLDDLLKEQPTNLRPHHADLRAPQNIQSCEPSQSLEVTFPALISMLAPVLPSAHANSPELEPTGRDILQSIRDLSKRFDLLATNERADTLDARVDSVEERFGWRLMELEKQIITSDARWQSLSSSVGNLAMSLRAHQNYPAAHHHHSNSTKYAEQNAARHELTESISSVEKASPSTSFPAHWQEHSLGSSRRSAQLPAKSEQIFTGVA
ncbi:uncharacterized protein F5891DRAFT_1194610 [Suillus fuscotomentosus]|uniref:Uncharacterized protein n=1 Tax=Suillus fuscotomentosus TaxID=1912939 RepID=A0AAD4HGY2_9AGAM|nr:uncharacterized protein F5891DRAFT_1194610 [Suillus fuscotomentosus]KAG1895094.1 hypothetical protein F5891DRAFT_1194610 [Suillus fuscotomentosus]